MGKRIFWFVAALFLGLWAHHVWLRVGKPEMTDAVRTKYGKNFVALSQGTTAYQFSKGEATPVVLVNGFSMPSVVWHNTFAAIADAGHTVIRFDLYGRGFSDRPEKKYDAELFATQLNDLTQKLIPGEKFILCGLSMGGAISVYYANKYPEKIAKMILLAPAGFPMDVPLTGKIAKLPGIGDYLGRLMAKNALEKSMANSYSTKVPEASAAEARRQVEYAGYADAIVSTLRHMNLTSMGDAYASVGKKAIPTLLIWGKQDKVVPYANAALVQKAIPHAEFLPLERAGHIPHVDAEKATNQRILDFVDAD